MASLGERSCKTPGGSLHLLQAACTNTMQSFVPDLGSPAPSVQRPCSNAFGVCSLCKLTRTGALRLESGDGGRGCTLSRPGSPGNILESIQKFCAARAKRKYKRAQPPTTLGVARPDLITPAAPPAAAHTLVGLLGRLAINWVLPLQRSSYRRGNQRVLALLFGVPCPTMMHLASPPHRRRPRTPPAHRRRARPGASPKRAGSY